MLHLLFSLAKILHMKKCSHLTEYERYQISALHKSRHNNAFIAKHLSRKSTQNARRLTPFYWACVEHLLQEYWSPEQIHGNLKVMEFEGGDLHKYLRCKKKY